MKIKIIMNTIEKIENSANYIRTSNQIWEGEIDIPTGILVTKISIIAAGEPHPICDVPFSLSEGHWHWLPGDPDELFGALIEPEKLGALIEPEKVERLGTMAIDEKGRKITP